MPKETREMAGWQTSWFADTTPINWEVKGNPKRTHGKSYARFELYFGAETVKQYLEKGGTKGDLKYDWQHMFLSLGDGTESPVSAAQDPLDVIENAMEERKKEHGTKRGKTIESEEDLLS